MKTRSPPPPSTPAEAKPCIPSGRSNVAKRRTGPGRFTLGPRGVAGTAFEFQMVFCSAGNDEMTFKMERTGSAPVTPQHNHQQPPGHPEISLLQDSGRGAGGPFVAHSAHVTLKSLLCNKTPEDNTDLS